LFSTAYSNVPILVLGGDLYFHINKEENGYFSEDRARFYAAELVLALDYLHQSRKFFNSSVVSIALLLWCSLEMCFCECIKAIVVDSRGLLAESG